MQKLFCARVLCLYPTSECLPPFSPFQAFWGRLRAVSCQIRQPFSWHGRPKSWPKLWPGKLGCHPEVSQLALMMSSATSRVVKKAFRKNNTPLLCTRQPWSKVISEAVPHCPLSAVAHPVRKASVCTWLWSGSTVLTRAESPLSRLVRTKE